jgi:CelD/BcsL family acetyltransferase involved in cellulose biosynthesis
MITVREINDSAGLAEIRALWSALLAKTPGASYFQSLEWLETYWEHFGSGQRLRTLVVSFNGTPIGILPLVVRQQRRVLGSLRVLGYPLDDWGSFYGPIGLDPATILLAGAAHIRATRRDWDLFELAWVDAQGLDGGRTQRSLAEAGLKTSADRGAMSALIELNSHRGWDSYWQSLGSHWRNNVRRSERKLGQRGEIRYVRYRPAANLASEAPDPRWDWYDACESIARSSWQGTSKTGTTLTHQAIRPFLRDCHLRAVEAGALDLNLLLIDDRPVAFNYAYHYRGYVFGLRTGFDPSLAAEGAGTILQARMIEDCFARGDRTYDLGPGYLDCKRHWQTTARASYRYTHFPTIAPIAQLARAKRGIERLLGWGKPPASKA